MRRQLEWNKGQVLGETVLPMDTLATSTLAFRLVRVAIDDRGHSSRRHFTTFLAPCRSPARAIYTPDVCPLSVCLFVSSLFASSSLSLSLSRTLITARVSVLIGPLLIGRACTFSCPTSRPVLPLIVAMLPRPHHHLWVFSRESARVVCLSCCFLLPPATPYTR